MGKNMKYRKFGVNKTLKNNRSRITSNNGKKENKVKNHLHTRQKTRKIRIKVLKKSK